MLYSHEKAYQPPAPTEIESDGLHMSLPPVSPSLLGVHSCSPATSTPVGSLIGALNSTLPIYLPQPREALKDPEQARLLTLYTDHLSGWVSSSTKIVYSYNVSSAANIKLNGYSWH